MYVNCSPFPFVAWSRWLSLQPHSVSSTHSLSPSLPLSLSLLTPLSRLSILYIPSYLVLPCLMHKPIPLSWLFLAPVTVLRMAKTKTQQRCEKDEHVPQMNTYTQAHARMYSVQFGCCSSSGLNCNCVHAGTCTGTLSRPLSLP
ncbi:hypothetical protein LX32DRAFT_163285 [Colletotrichum zoysiae]|uniref:Uncharacterized protein n=1 Tax=Colletotrichum zoysiae TaxID=1216348 RepID=A0AAD9LYM6_9PEZI|nr:hypothetical protein LX32DRAFT_163285 [Colletotrichum zoysiae]